MPVTSRGWKRQGNDAPQGFQKEPALPAHTLILAQGDPELTSGLQNYEVTNLCCCKLPSSWSFATAEKGH